MTIRRKLLLTLLSITLLAAAVISISLWFAKVTETDAAAINEAGSLRMQSWRLAEHIVVPELVTEDILAPLMEIYDSSIEQDTLTILADWDNAIGEQYRQIYNEWKHTMRPMLTTRDFEGYVVAVPGFVDRIDAMVDALQQNTERKLEMLYIAMLVALISLMVLAVLMFRDIRRSLLEPIGDLAWAAGKIGRREFDIDLQYDAPNELGQLTCTFNVMAHELHSLYHSLELQVEAQTKALSRSNAALQLLYSSSRTLGDNPFDRGNMISLLEGWQKLLGLQGCYLCLSGAVGNDKLQRVEPESSLSISCDGGRCVTCLDDYGAECQNTECGSSDANHFPVSVAKDNQRYGFLRAIPAGGVKLSDEERQWLQVFVDILATALSQNRQREHERRLLLMEERAVIARELHDSLAQALSYQKIQISRLRRQLPESGVAREIVDELQDGVSSAYRQLRELLVTFRLSMAEGSLKDNITRTLEEFRQRARDIQFDLDYRIRFSPVDAHQEIHVLQIVREALSNVVKHSEANQCRVSCYQVDGREVLVTVDDNGKGINENPEKPGHYGLIIARERASSLEGEMALMPSPLGGTRVQLRFKTALIENQKNAVENLAD